MRHRPRLRHCCIIPDHRLSIDIIYRPADRRLPRFPRFPAICPGCEHAIIVTLFHNHLLIFNFHLYSLRCFLLFSILSEYGGPSKDGSPARRGFINPATAAH